MKVLHVIPSLAARDGGPSEAIIHLCRALIAGDVEVDLAYTTAGEGEGEGEAIAGDMISPKINLIELPRIGSERFKYAPGFGRRIGKRIGRYDLVHIHAIFSHTSISAARAARSAKRPYVLRPLGSLSPFALRQSPMRKKLFLALGVRDLIRDAAAIHCTSTSEERDVCRAFDVRQTFALPNGVEDSLFDIRPAPRRPLVLFLGRLDRKKNVPILIEAFARAGSDGWRLVIGGEGESSYENSLRNLASRSGAAIEFAGWVHGEEKRELLRSASLFVLPSSDENFGIAVAEAMAAGVPVIISPQVSLAEVVVRTDSGWVVPAEPEPLASVLRTSMANADSIESKGENARRTAEQNFRWPRIGKELIHIYQQLSGNPVLSETAAPHGFGP
jgi:glycosyltransferase involved in cell wall biosynthesis